MFPALPQEVRDELQALSLRYGNPITYDVAPQFEGSFDPLSKSDRYSEVCMVVRRPSGRLITALKTFYPRDAHRLLTGGIHHGEAIADALLRETAEETGLEVTLRRFLAAIAYTPIYAGHMRSATPAFYTFAFLLDETGGELASHDPDERLERFVEIEPSELRAIAERLNGLDSTFDPEVNGRWRDWGRFRAIAHRAVWEALVRLEKNHHRGTEV